MKLFFKTEDFITIGCVECMGTDRAAATIANTKVQTLLERCEKMREALVSIEKQSKKKCVLEGCCCVMNIAQFALSDFDKYLEGLK